MTAPTLAHDATGTDSRQSDPVQIAPADKSPAAVTQDMLVQAIRRECAEAGVPCTQADAVYVDEMLGRATQRIIGGRQRYFLTARDMRIAHQILDTVMPDDTTHAAPGTAHGLIQGRHHLPDDARVLVHTKQELGGADQCVIGDAIRAA